MGSTSSIVEINGNQYDAYSGQLIKAGKKTTKQVKYHTARVIDGFVRSSTTRITKKNLSKKTATADMQATVKTTPTARARFVHSAKVLHQRTEKSRTLMRGAVAKPVTMAKKSLSENFSSSVKPYRQERANKVVKHAKVRRFGTTEVSLRPADDKKTAASSSIRSETPAVLKASAGGHAAVATMPMAGLSHQRLERMLDHALAQADAHKQRLKGRPSSANIWQRIKHAPRWISIGSMALVVILLILFFVWQSIPQVAIRVANVRAHMNATMPSYTPTGFSFWKPVLYQNGMVTVRYRSTINPSSVYDLSQQKSSWDSASLASSIGTKTQVQTTQVNGTTIFVYGAKGNAAWVNRGLLYKISDSASLSPDQIVRIAQSM